MGQLCPNLLVTAQVVCQRPGGRVYYVTGMNGTYAGCWHGKALLNQQHFHVPARSVANGNPHIIAALHDGPLPKLPNRNRIARLE